MFHDHDIDFNEESSHLKRKFNLRLRKVNKYPVGTALTIGPLYSLACAFFFPVFKDKSDQDFPWVLDQCLFSYCGILVGGLGLWIVYLFVSLYYPKKISIIATLSFWACSPLIYYFTIEPYWSHLPALLASTLFFYIWRKPDIFFNIRFVLLGAVGALSAITRHQDVIILLLPLGLLVLQGKWKMLTLKKRICACFCFSMGFLSIFIIQIYAWYAQYDTYLINAYKANGEGFIYLTNPKLLQVLFSSNHGLISWHPLMAICLAGLILATPLLRPFNWVLLMWFMLHCYITASWWGWGMGGFGNRSFITLSPIFTLGLASVFDRLTRTSSRIALLGCICILCIWNIIFMMAYSSDMIPKYGTFSWWNLWIELPNLGAHIMRKLGG